MTPQEAARGAAIRARIEDMTETGAKYLTAGDYKAAEAEYREALKDYSLPQYYFGLGEALEGQGRVAEAITTYRAGIYVTPGQFPDPNHTTWKAHDWSGLPVTPTTSVWLHYALLLSQTGQSAEALAVYKRTLPDLPQLGVPQSNFPLASGPPSPAALQAAAHIALGLSSASTREETLKEFDTARKLQPDSPLANYFYAYGWQNLDPKDPAKAANAAQAKAALQKAAKSSNPDVKKAALKALQAIAVTP